MLALVLAHGESGLDSLQGGGRVHLVCVYGSLSDVVDYTISKGLLLDGELWGLGDQHYFFLAAMVFQVITF